MGIRAFGVRATSAVLTVFMLGSSISAHAQDDAEGGAVVKPRKLALLIGVRDYPPEVTKQFREIYGAQNDVRAMTTILRTHFQFEGDDIHSLVDQDATLERVIGEFTNWLIPTARAGDVVFVFYAGHGSVVPDMQSRERSAEKFGVDSSYVLWDSRRDGALGQFDLTDDELQSLLAPIVDNGAHLFVATDACHSAGGTRGPPPRAVTPIRMAPEGSVGVGQDNLPACWPPNIPFLEDRDPRRPALDKYVHFAACRKDEFAQEWEGVVHDPSTSNGVFTLLLLEALRLAAAAPGTWTYENLHGAVMWRFPQYLDRLEYSQNPSPDGGIERLLFDGAYRAPPGRFAVAGLEHGRVQFDAGDLAGIEVGSRLVVVDHEGVTVGTVHIDATDPIASSGNWEKEVERAVDGALFADWVTPPPSLDPITIFDPTRQIEALLQHDGEPLEIVRYDRTPRYFATGGTGAVEPLLAIRPGDPLRLVAPDGAIIVDKVFLAEDAPERAELRRHVIARLRDEVSYVALTKLIGRRGELELDVKLRAPTDEDLIGPWKKKMTRLDVEQVGLEPEYRCTHDRALNDVHFGTIEITNRAKDPVYVHVISLTPDHWREPIHPTKTADKNNAVPLAAGEKEIVHFVIAIPDDWPDARTYFDQYLVLASMQPLDVRALMARERLRGAGDEALPAVLEEALRGEVTRGSGIADKGADRRVGYSGFRLAIRVGSKD